MGDFFITNYNWFGEIFLLLTDVIIITEKVDVLGFLINIQPQRNIKYISECWLTRHNKIMWDFNSI